MALPLRRLGQQALLRWQSPEGRIPGLIAAHPVSRYRSGAGVPWIGGRDLD
jgi:hypothetical protein